MHELRGVAHRSPSTQAMNAEYRRHRAAQLAENPWCHWCGAPADTADHLVPVARGGTHARSNLVSACSTCNLSRRDDPEWVPPRERGGG